MRWICGWLAFSLLGCTPSAEPAPAGEKVAWVEHSATPPPSLNLLLNPGFEEDWYNRSFAEQRRFLLLQASDIGMGDQDGKVDHWTVSEPDPGKFWDLEVAHSGRRSLRFQVPGQASQRLRWVGQNGWQVGGAHYGGFLPMAAGLAQQVRRRPIVVGAWCKTQGATAAPRLKVDFMMQDRPKWEVSPLGTPAQQSRSADFEGGSHDWQYREIVVTPSPGPPVHFVVVSVEAPSGGAWFDDVTVVEKPLASEVNLVPNGGFEVGAWSAPQLWRWMRNEYYTFTGWTHEDSKKWRGQAVIDPLVHYSGRASLRFSVFPGDNFAVASAPIQLAQKRAQPLEVRAVVRADQLRSLEIMAQDEHGKWLPQGDFVGDDMENNPALYNMGTTGSGSYDWICVRKFFSPQQPLSSVRLFLCARGFDGERVPKNHVGTVWWDDVQLYQHGDDPGQPVKQVAGSAVAGLDGRVGVDLGERLYGDNQLTLTLPGPARARLKLVAPDGGQHESSASGSGRLVLPYRVDKLCTGPDKQYKLHLSVEQGGSTHQADYAFGTPTALVECEVDRYFAYPDEKIEVVQRLNLSSRELAKVERIELLGSGRPLSSLTGTQAAALGGRPRSLPDFVDGRGTLAFSLSSCQSKVHPWNEPTRDLALVSRLQVAGKVLAQSAPVAVGFMEKIPPPQFPARITTTKVDPRGYLRINDRPYFAVYWTPNFDRVFEGNYPPRLFGYPSVDLNDLPRDKVLQKVAEARANPKFFAYELGDGEMQLQGAGWPLRLQAVKKAMGWLREADPQHLINGPESWLVGHPGHQQAMKIFMPLYDVIGVETSFDEVPQPRPFRESGHACAVLAGLEAYYYQPVEGLRWRGYRSIYEGCAGVGLCPSEMLKARPAHVNYLRGLNGEFRGLEAVFTAPEPAARVSAQGSVQLFERVLEGRHYLFALSAPEARGFPLKVTFQGVTGPIKVRGEGRSLKAEGSFSDTFAGPRTVHVYEF
ncbi:hypothetical protein IV102_36255 [bacterium]|nr:hypothetical protein [bacterium]